MTAEKVKKTEKHGLEPYRPSGWVLPFERMEEMFNDLFRRPFTGTRWPELSRMLPELEPPMSVDVYEEGSHIVVKADLPGISKDDIEITLTDQNLTITGEKKKEEKVEKKDYYRLERSYGSFRRSIALPADLNTDKAKASFKDGVLEIKVPKTEESKRKGRKIKVE
jgi:HSP20 family protein